MSNPRIVLVGAALGGGALALLAVLGAARQRWELVVAAGAVYAVIALLVQVDTWRRTRTLRNYLRDEIRRTADDRSAVVPAIAHARPADVTRDDVLGVVRVMQAQYTGRLDRLQTTVEQALAGLPADRQESGSGSGD